MHSQNKIVANGLKACFDLIDEQPEAKSLFLGNLITVGEVAKLCISANAELLLEMKPHRDKTPLDLVDLDKIPSFVTDLAKDYMWGTYLPMVGRSESIKYNGKMLRSPGFKALVSPSVSGFHDPESPPSDHFSRPYLQQEMARLIKLSGYNIQRLLDVEVSEKGMISITAPIPDGQSGFYTFYFDRVQKHPSIDQLDRIAKNVVKNLLIRTVCSERVADLVDICREAIASELNDNAILQSIDIVDAFGPYGGYERSEIELKLEIEVEFTGPLLDRETEVFDLEIIEGEPFKLPSKIKKLGQRLRKREGRKHLVIDAVFAAKMVAEDHEFIREIIRDTERTKHGEKRIACCGYSIKGRDGVLAINFDLNQSPWIYYENGQIVFSQALPRSIRMGMKNKPAREIIDHPWLEGVVVTSAYLKKNEDGNESTHLRLRVPEVTLEELANRIGEDAQQIIDQYKREIESGVQEA